MSADPRPPPPFLDIRPNPEQLKECSRQNLVFGFPITNEWFFELYEAMKKKREVKEAPVEFVAMAGDLAALCQAMYPEWGHIDLLVVECEDYGMCTLIRVGAAGWKPPKSVIAGMAKELRKYGLVERPNWFPGTGLKSTPRKSVHGRGLTRHIQTGFDCRVGRVRQRIHSAGIVFGGGLIAERWKSVRLKRFVPQYPKANWDLTERNYYFLCSNYIIEPERVAPNPEGCMAFSGYRIAGYYFHHTPRVLVAEHSKNLLEFFFHVHE